MRSIIIFGKGPSLLRCTKQFVDQYDDIAICNYPVMNDFFYPLIKNRTILYHFANCCTFDNRYTDSSNEALRIQGIYNTHYITDPLPYKDFLRNKTLFKDNIRGPMEKYFQQRGFDPSTGTLALQYVLNSNIYNKIALVGFDNFKKGDQMYYFTPAEYADSIKYLLNKNVIAKDGTYQQTSGHDPDKTRQFYESVFINNPHVQFDIMTNMNIDELENLTVL